MQREVIRWASSSVDVKQCDAITCYFGLIELGAYFAFFITHYDLLAFLGRGHGG